MFQEKHLHEILFTTIALTVFIVLRVIITRITKTYVAKANINEQRANLVRKYIHILLFIFLLVALLAIWNVNPKDLFIVMSSVFAVIGVGLFAQWSILSNITSGIILFFSFPFRIGDRIKIHDADFPIEAQIEDIKAFHTLLRTKNNELLTYPNNLFLQKGITIITARQEEREFYD